MTPFYNQQSEYILPLLGRFVQEFPCLEAWSSWSSSVVPFRTSKSCCFATDAYFRKQPSFRSNCNKIFMQRATYRNQSESLYQLSYRMSGQWSCFYPVDQLPIVFIKRELAAPMPCQFKSPCFIMSLKRHTHTNDTVPCQPQVRGEVTL